MRCAAKLDTYKEDGNEEGGCRAQNFKLHCMANTKRDKKRASAAAAALLALHLRF